MQGVGRGGVAWFVCERKEEGGRRRGRGSGAKQTAEEKKHEHKTKTTLNILVTRRLDANTTGRFGPVSVCVVAKGSIYLPHVVVPVVLLFRFHFVADGSELFFVFCRRVPYFSVNFDERLPCTWLTRVMMAPTATHPLTPKCSREKHSLSLFLASDHSTNKLFPTNIYAAALFSHETTFGFVHTKKPRSCDALAGHASSSFQLKESHHTAGG